VTRRAQIAIVGDFNSANVTHEFTNSALEHVGHERLVFGSDRPPVPFPLERSLGHVRALNLATEHERAVLGENAEKLFRLA